MDTAYKRSCAIITPQEYFNPEETLVWVGMNTIHLGGLSEGLHWERIHSQLMSLTITKQVDDSKQPQINNVPEMVLRQKAQKSNVASEPYQILSEQTQGHMLFGLSAIW